MECNNGREVVGRGVAPSELAPWWLWSEPAQVYGRRVLPLQSRAPWRFALDRVSVTVFLELMTMTPTNVLRVPSSRQPLSTVYV